MPATTRIASLSATVNKLIVLVICNCNYILMINNNNTGINDNVNRNAGIVNSSSNLILRDTTGGIHRPHKVVVQSDFLLQTQLGTLQYCVFKPVTAMLGFMLQVPGLYASDSAFDYKTGWPYLAFINSCSQTWAMYCLILFYHALHDEL